MYYKATAAHEVIFKQVCVTINAILGRLANVKQHNTREVAGSGFWDMDHCHPLKPSCAISIQELLQHRECLAQTGPFFLPLLISHNESPLSDIQASKYKH